MSLTPSITIPSARWQEMISEMEGLMKLNEMLSENLAEKKSDVDYLQKNISQLEESNSKLQSLIEVIENNHRIAIENLQKECSSHMAHARAAAIELEKERRQVQILRNQQAAVIPAAASGSKLQGYNEQQQYQNALLLTGGNNNNNCTNSNPQGILHPQQEINDLQQLLRDTQNALAVLQELHSHCKEINYDIVPSNHLDLYSDAQARNQSNMPGMNTPQKNHQHHHHNNLNLDRNTLNLPNETRQLACNDGSSSNALNTPNGQRNPYKNPSNASQNFQSFQDLISQSSTSSLSQSPPLGPEEKRQIIDFTPQMDRQNNQKNDGNDYDIDGPHNDLMASSIITNSSCSNSNQAVVSDFIRLPQLHARAATEAKINPRREVIDVLHKQKTERFSIQVQEVASSGQHKICYQQPQQQIQLIRSSLQTASSPKEQQPQLQQQQQQPQPTKRLSKNQQLSSCASSSKSSKLEFRVERPEFRMSESHIISETLQQSQKQQGYLAVPAQTQHRNNKYRTSIEEEQEIIKTKVQQRSQSNQAIQQQQQQQQQPYSQLSNDQIYLHSSSQSSRQIQGNNRLRVNRNSNTPQPASNYLISSSSSPRPPLNKTAACASKTAIHTSPVATGQVSAFMIPPPVQVHRALSNKLVESQIVPTETLMHSQIYTEDNNKKTDTQLEQQQQDIQISIRPHREAAVSQKEQQQQQQYQGQKEKCQEINGIIGNNRSRDNQSAPEVIGVLNEEIQANRNICSQLIANSMPQQHSPKRFSFQVDVNPMLSSNDEEHSKEILNQVKKQQGQQDQHQQVADNTENQEEIAGGIQQVIENQGAQEMMTLKMTSSLYEQQHHEQHYEEKENQQKQQQQYQQSNEQGQQQQQQVFQLPPQQAGTLNINDQQVNDSTYSYQPTKQPQQSGEQVSLNF